MRDEEFMDERGAWASVVVSGGTTILCMIVLAVVAFFTITNEILMVFTGVMILFVIIFQAITIKTGLKVYEELYKENE